MGPSKALRPYKVYLASRKSLSSVVARIVPPHEIEDIVQETYVRICQIKNTENISSPKSFIYKTLAYCDKIIFKIKYFRFLAWSVLIVGTKN